MDAFLVLISKRPDGHGLKDVIIAAGIKEQETLHMCQGVREVTVGQCQFTLVR
jgi:hypothetical protein